MPLTSQQYTDECWIKARAYVEGVSNKTIITNVYIKQAVEKFKRMNLDKRYTYRVDKVDRLFKFLSYLNIETKNQYKQMELMPWQCFVLAAIYGFYYSDDIEKRVVNEAFIFIGRKNGKSCFSAALQLYGLVGDNVVNPQSILVANTSQQASICLNFEKDIINHSEPLKERLIGQRSRVVFKDPNKQGFSQVMSTVDPARLEGTSPSCCIIDEIHNFDNASVYNAIKLGTGARLNPLMLIISTAGSKLNGFCNDFVKRHTNVLNGKIDDDSTFGALYTLDDGDDMDDVNVWIKSNPSLGVTNSLKDLIRLHEQSKDSFQNRFFFVSKILNIFFDSPDVWIPDEEVVTCYEDFDEETLYGRDAYIGLDLSKTTDLTAMAIVVPVPEENLVYCIPYFWIADRPSNIVRKSGLDLTNWIRAGHITKCDSKIIDTNMVYDKIIELSSRFNIVNIMYDKYNAIELTTKLKDYGLECTSFSQVAQRFNLPLKEIESMIYNKKLKFKNPVMRNQFGNIVLYVDGNANIKIVKNKQNDSVDGPVSFAMAVGGMLESKYGVESVGLRSYLEGIQS